jgi:hypothetical protein
VSEKCNYGTVSGKIFSLQEAEAVIQSTIPRFYWTFLHILR